MNEAITEIHNISTGLKFVSGDISAIGGYWIPHDTNTLDIKGKLNATEFSDETIRALKNYLGYGDVVVKCQACGQWGAIKTACRHCGHPIDPE